MHYYIIGTSHTLQCELPFHDLQDSRLRDKLEEVISAHSVVLIAEEVNANEEHNQVIHGRNLASNHDPAIPWLSLDMTTQQMKNAGIWNDLEAASELTKRACENGTNELYHPVRANDTRESCWLEKIRAVCDAYKLTSGTVLITCGRVHLDPLADKASKCGIKDIETAEVPIGLGRSIGDIRHLS